MIVGNAITVAGGGGQRLSTSMPFALCAYGNSQFLPVSDLRNYSSQIVVVSFPEVTGVGSSVFSEYYSRLTSVDLPACTYVGEGAFYGCKSLVSVNLPACETVGNYAFESCRSLPAIDLPACTFVGESAFHSCYALASANLPTCTSLGGYAFCDCLSLTEVSLPMCSHIGACAFDSGMTLIGLTSTEMCQVEDNTFVGLGSFSVIVASGLLSQYVADPLWQPYYSRLYDTNGEWGGDYYEPTPGPTPSYSSY